MSRRMPRLAVVAALLLLAIGLIGALGRTGCEAPTAAAQESLPSGPGLAAAYPGDREIAGDPAVVFAADFEGADFSAWDDLDGNRPPEVELTTEPANVHAGAQAAQLTVPAGPGVGADLTKWLDPGYDCLFARWYCRYAADYDQGNLHHAGGNLVAARDRALLGVSGVKPDGTDRFCTGLETWRDWGRNPAPGELFFYTYYPDMTRDPDGNYWGNSFRPDQPVLLERARWYCLEMMVKANTLGAADGEQAFWVDGDLRGHFTGIRWRTTDALRLNCFWLLLYIHDSSQANRMWVDDVVVATRYIGPMQPGR